MYNFCDEFNIEVNGQRIDAVFCYRISSMTEKPLFNIGYIKNRQYHEIQTTADNIRFDRDVIG